MLEEPRIIKIGDQEFKVEGLTQVIQSAFEKYMQHHLLQQLKKSRDMIGDSDYFELLSKHITDIHSGRMSFDLHPDSIFSRFMNDVNHFAELLWYMLSAHQPIAKEVVTKWITEQPDEAVEMFKVACLSKKN